MAPGVIDQNLAHDMSSNGEKMRPVLKSLPGKVYHPEIRFIDQSGCLKGVIGPLLAHPVPGDAAQFRLEKGQQMTERALVAAAPAGEQFCYLG